MKPLEAIRCTTPSCGCECFLPSKPSLRTCETCKHGWVAHALDKLGYRHVFNVGLQVEIVQPNIVFDIASLMLYGAQATPIRLKILLDRLFSVLQHEEVLQVLHGFGWSYEDYARGYILQVSETSGRVLDKWMCATREEEFIIMQQFLRFGETKSIAQEIILQDTKERQDVYIKQSSRSDSEIKKFIERSNMSMQTLIRPFDVRHLFGARLPYISPTGNRLLSPPLGFSTPTSSPRGDLRPPLISVSSTSPVTTSPLGRLQTMQPFDFRRESASPAALSPGEKQQSSSPKSDSPQNLSMTSASAQSTPPHTPYTPHKFSDLESPLSHLPKLPQSVTLGAPALILPALQRHQNCEEGVINFSLKEDQDSLLYHDRKNKHLRKSSNPIKRNWMPDPSFGTSMIGPNGKKRVLCSACNKTFCDKGALKIHYSAVHLKEMHKCSVEGCTMMFSSRRSRNRHSANPNPKLHMPQKRPKIPEGARLIDDGTSHLAKRQLSSPPMMTAGLVSRSPVNMGDSPKQRPFYVDPNIQMPVFPTSAKRLKLDSDDDAPKDLSLPLMKSGHNSREDSPGNASLSLVPDHMLDEYQNAIKGGFDDSQDSDNSRSENAMSTNSPGPQRSHNRRKNIPIRCAQPTDHFMESEEKNTHVKQEPGIVDDESQNKGHIHENNGNVIDRVRVAENGIEDGRQEKMGECSEGEEMSMDKSDGKLVIDDEDFDDDDDDDMDGRDTGEVLDFAMHMPDDLEGDNLSAMSGQESNVSHASDAEDSSDASKWNQEELSELDIPVDKENPKQCVSCGKTFLNLFGLKIHYKNVHLKLMHTCTVEGCGATFPSKRSRDRHSSNLNLHRKLLSTTDEQKPCDEADDNQNFRAGVIQKLYENQSTDSTETDKVNSVVNGDSYSVDNTNENMRPHNDENISEQMNGSVSKEVANDENVESETPENSPLTAMNNDVKSSTEVKVSEKISPATRKSRRQLSQSDLHKNMLVGDKALSV